MTESSYLFYHEGKATSEMLIELHCQFRLIADQNPSPLYPLENARPNSLVLKVTPAKRNYVGKYTGSISKEGFDAEANASIFSPTIHSFFWCAQAQERTA